VSALALLIGNKNYSSWSLRPWFALRQSGLAFDEERVPMNTPEFAERVRAWSPAGRVPVLRHGALAIWDSLAICEYLADTFPDTRLWPADPAERAHARAVSAEMHSGFPSLRSQMPMNVRAKGRKVPATPELTADIARISAIWRGCRERAGARGPFLFGDFSIADAMFGPVAFRFATYGVALEPVASEYAEALRSTPALRAWAEAAARETETIPAGEVGT
jgi:glutathione S-transferase